MKRSIMALAALFATGEFSAAQAEANCYGTITHVFTNAAGDLLVHPTYRQGWTQLCNVNEPWNGISVQTCWSWFATVNNSLLQNKVVAVNYPTVAAEGCATLPTYGTSPKPSFVMLQQ